MIHPSVAQFKGGLHEQSLPFLEVLTPSSPSSLLLWLIHIYSILSQLMRPKSIKLVYPIWYKDPPPMATYCPISNSNADSDANSPNPYSNLHKITIEIYRLPDVLLRNCFLSGVRFFKTLWTICNILTFQESGL